MLVTVFDESLLLKSYALAAELRNAGLNVMVFPEAAKLPKQFKFADKMKMKATLVLGPDEDAKGQVAVKNLSNGEQVTVARELLVDTVRTVIGEIMMSLSIRPVTKDNWRALAKLKVREDQTHFVASNLYSIAESQFGFDEPDGSVTGICIPFGIYDDDSRLDF